VGGYDPAFGSYYEDVDLAFRLRWAGFSCQYAPDCRIYHEVSASYDHARPDLQRRMSRNAEILFWTNLPVLWLAAALAPHLAFVLAQAAWRLARGRFTPFALGKLDALRALPSFREKRSQRVHFAKTAISRPHFPLGVPSFTDAKNHLRRPKEASALRP
jgi:GT2 family glycosyltransferase